VLPVDRTSSAADLTKLSGVEQRLQRQLQQVARRTSAFAMFGLILVVAFALVSVYGFRLLTRVDDRLRALDSSSQPAAAPAVGAAATTAAPAAAATSDSHALDRRLTTVENLQEAIADNSRGAFEQMNYVFTIVAAFFGLFSIFFAYRQVKTDSARDAHDEEMRSLVASFQHNISTISSLITTLQQVFDYRTQIQDELGRLGERAKTLESDRAESAAAMQSLLLKLNTESLRLFTPDIERANLGLEDTRRTFDTFASKLTTAERLRKVEDSLNPFCYYVRGLSQLGIYEYDAAIADLTLASRKGRADRVRPELANYAEDDRENLESRLDQMIVASSYFQGVGYKNLGRYADARAKFQEALDRDAAHLQSQTYLLQVMYLDLRNVPFEETERAYDRAIERFKTFERDPKVDEDRLKRAYSFIRANQGCMYLKRPFVYSDTVKPYERLVDNTRAIACLREARSAFPSEFATFALAQALDNVGASEWGSDRPQDLFQEVAEALKRRVAEDLDRLYSVVNHYMLAICARKFGRSEAVQAALFQARNGLKDIPSHVTCYSPISRIRLSRQEILEEMSIFEGKFR
jgi:tetratricopeptide (TPR) repeat protein